MALKPGGRRSPSTRPRPSPPDEGGTRPPRGRRGRSLWSRAATVAVLRQGLLIAGLVIIVDLLTQLYEQRTVSADDIANALGLNLFVNVVLFSLLGVLVVRQTGLILTAVVAGLVASLLDGIVTAAAALMAPPSRPLPQVEFDFVLTVAIGTVFAAVSGAMYLFAQRTGGRRSR